MVDEEEHETVRWSVLRDKYIWKFDNKQNDIQQLRDTEADETQIVEAIEKAVHYHQIIEECNLKIKLTNKRALSICLTLLKQCRANIQTDDFVAIITHLLLPALTNTTDKELQYLGIQNIGLLQLVDASLFENYSKVF